MGWGLYVQIKIRWSQRFFIFLPMEKITEYMFPIANVASHHEIFHRSQEWVLSTANLRTHKFVGLYFYKSEIWSGLHKLRQQCWLFLLKGFGGKKSILSPPLASLAHGLCLYVKISSVFFSSLSVSQPPFSFRFKGCSGHIGPPWVGQASLPSYHP